MDKLSLLEEKGFCIKMVMFCAPVMLLCCVCSIDGGYDLAPAIDLSRKDNTRV